MEKYIVISKYDNKTKIRKLWRSNESEIEYDTCFIKTHENTPMAASQITPGDIFSADSSNILHALSYSPNRSYDLKAFLQSSNLKPYISIAYPKFRSFSYILPDFQLPFTFRLIDYCLLNSDKVILDTLKYYLPHLAHYIDYFSTKVLYCNYEKAIYESFCYIEYIKYISDDIFMRFGQNLNNLYSILQLRIKIINTHTWDCSIYNESGKFELTFFNYSNIYDILYTPKEVGLMKNLSSGLTITPPNIQELKQIYELDLNKSQKDYEQTLIIFEQYFSYLIKNGRLNNLWTVLQQINIPQNYRAQINNIINSLLCSVCQQVVNIIKLRCSHSLCSDHFIDLVNRGTSNKVVMNFQEEVVPLQCVANGCGKIIDYEIIKANYPNYEFYAEEAEKRIMINCSKCRTQGGKSSYFVICRHLCNNCVVDSIRNQEFHCTVCNRRFNDEELNYFRSLKRKCEGCEEEFFWIKYFPKRLCKHFLCLECISATTNMICFFKTCPPFNITPSELRKLCKVQCENCKGLYRKAEFYWMHKACECLLCYDCQVSSENPQKLTNCSICSAEFNEMVQGFLERKNSEYNNMATRPCLICYRILKINQIENLMNCGHYFCKNCLNDYAINKLKSINDINKLQYCPDTECNKLIPPNQLESIFNPEIVQKFNYFNIINTLRIIHCPKCSNQFESNFIRKTICLNPECKFLFCRFCNKEYHEEGDCNETYIKERIEELKEDEGGVTQCPRCRIPYIKDPTGCKHVDCINPECLTSFCFECACLRSPLLAHGAHYHRKQCQYYSAYPEDEDKKRDDCLECTRLGKLCPRPKDLRVARLVAPDEKE